MDENENLIYDIKPIPEEKAEIPVEEQEGEQERPQEEKTFFTRKKEEFFLPRKKKGRKIFIFSGLILILIASYAAFFVLPRASIVVHPKRIEKELNGTAVASPAIALLDTQNKKIPGENIVLKRELTKEYAVPASQNVSAKATGIISVINAYSEKPQTLVATTRFRSSDGKIFRITENIVIPGERIANGKLVPSSIDIKAVADQAGAEYNVPPGRFDIPGFEGTAKFKGFYGISRMGMAGGASGMGKIVTNEVMDKAKADAYAALSALLKTELAAKTTEGEKIIDGAENLAITNASFNRKIGDIAESIALTESVELHALLFKESDMQKIIEKSLGTELSENEVLRTDISYKGVQFDVKTPSLLFSYDAKIVLRSTFDQKAFVAAIEGKKPSELKSIVSGFPAIESLTVKLWPVWVGTIPANEGKINFAID